MTFQEATDPKYTGDIINSLTGYAFERVEQVW